MTKQKTTKRALLLSALSLLLCVSMLIGSTFAWFTDSVTTGSAVIQSGTLDIVLEYWNGTQWEDAEGKVLEFQKADTTAGTEVLWEPGCTYKLPKIRVRNVGNLAAYCLIKLDGVKGDEKLMEAIDLTTTITNMPASLLTGSQGSIFSQFNNATLNPIYGTPDGTIVFDHTVMGKGIVSPNSGHTDTSPEFTIAGHMKEEAGNEYQGLAIHGVSITVLATQSVFEYDSLGREYDANATLPEDDPLALVTTLNDKSVIKNPADVTVLGENKTVNTNGPLGWGIKLGDSISLDTAYQFEPSLSKADAEASQYADWHADFVVHANKNVPAYALALAGYYDAWCRYNNDAWVAIASDAEIAAGTEIRLVASLGGITVSYTELSEYGNDGVGFLCGAVETTDAMLADYGVTTPGLEEGTVLTVELRLYEATSANLNSETGNYIVVGQYDYKF